ncbi:hypothetical protein AJ78_04437 [Emergomyces pasteurianus Ep9510]|uniref:Uncharacterized protein n=1 Tax=Emergomyces pasteurianus Ep9510 TaxID=1447872 RepID=A0A1J9PFS2_9EURO|nr:hypothetical protein AJ78_04437 [Emergomyces pasteurianus Ep9510]
MTVKPETARIQHPARGVATLGWTQGCSMGGSFVQLRVHARCALGQWQKSLMPAKPEITWTQRALLPCDVARLRGTRQDATR